MTNVTGGLVQNSASTIADVARAVGVGTPTVYKLYGNKRTLMSAIADSWEEQLLPRAITAGRAGPELYCPQAHGLLASMTPRCRIMALMRVPTSALAAAGLIAGYGVAVATDSRPLGGVVLAACGLPCIVIWARRHDRRTAALLTSGGLAAFALSHGMGVLIGPWPSVVLTAALTSAAYWRLSDSRGRSGRLGHVPVGS